MIISNAVAIEFNNKELNALRVVDDVFEDLQEQFSKETTLISVVTGEAIELNEIWRMRGILATFVSNSFWDVSTPKNDDELDFSQL